MVSDLLGQLHRVAESRFRVSLMIDIATIVQGECRGKLAWPLLSRRRWSPLQLVCDGKGTKIIDAKQAIFRYVPNLFWLQVRKSLNIKDLQF